MNYFDKNKILTAAVVVLLVTNLGILGLLWFDRSPKNSNDKFSPDKRPPVERMKPPDGMPPPDRMPPEGGPKEFIIHELKLSEKQVQEYEILVKEHQSDMKELRNKIGNEKEELWDNISKPGADKNELEKTASEIGMDHKQIELVNFRHFQKVRELCNDEQRKKFDEIIKEALRMMGPNGPPPERIKN